MPFRQYINKVEKHRQAPRFRSLKDSLWILIRVWSCIVCFVPLQVLHSIVGCFCVDLTPRLQAATVDTPQSEDTTTSEVFHLRANAPETMFHLFIR